MRVAFLSHDDASDRHAWSGTLFYMFRALQRHCGEVVSLGPAGQFFYRVAGGIGRALRISGVRIDSTHLVPLARRMGTIFSHKLQEGDFDAVFAPAASTELAFLETGLPVVTCNDLTAELFRGYAAHLERLRRWSLQQMELIEQRALSRADQAVFASQWAAQSARDHYGVPQEKIHVVPLGANIDDAPPRSDVLTARSRRPSANCRLLFIAVDWQRKGGDVAINTLRELHRRGLDATLTIVGCSPPLKIEDPAVRVIPFLDKDKPADRQRLDQLFLQSDFLLFPSRHEAYGVVCCEANAFALPVIAHAVGGVPVVHGENGILLSQDASATQWADAVQQLAGDSHAYMKLAIGARDAFENRLNWDVWGKRMAAILQTARAERAMPAIV